MFEARGASLKKAQLDRERRPHHLRLFLHQDSTEDRPKWVLESHGSDTDPNPRADEFEGDQELLNLIVEHILGRSLTGRRRSKTRHSTMEETNGNENETQSEY